MRVAHIILSRGFAGSERATAEMCNAQCARHEVLLILKRNHTNRNGISIRQWLDPGTQVVEVDSWFPRRGIARALSEFKPDVVHGHLRRSTRMLSRIKPPAATVATLHISVNGPHFAQMDGLICIARWQRNDIPADYAGTVFDINLAYLPHRRLEAAEIQALRAQLGVQPEDFLVGGVGRLASSKGFDTLMQAFERARLPNSKLVIFGEGRERRRLERLCTPTISLAGFRPNIKDYYQVFDLFVCPSRREPLPYVLLEALDAGVPIVASDALGNAELLQAYAGDLFPANDVAALTEQLRRRYAARPPNRQHDLSPYALQTVIEQTDAAYRTLIERKALRRR